MLTKNDPAAVVTYRLFADPINVPAAALVGISIMMLDVVTFASVTVLVAAAAIVKLPVLLGKRFEKIATSFAMSWLLACSLLAISSVLML